jgi:ribonuclease D
MTEEQLPEPILITRQADLDKMVARLEQEPVVAVDTESNSLFAYYEQVCLLQFSIPGIDYLVDPLALDDLGALGPFFADPSIEKVFHAAEYDIICLKRDFSFSFSSLFDTMVAASILGMEQVGLGALLEKEFNVQLDKRFQRANWGQRPLPRNLLTYARMDTHYLIELRIRMKAALESMKRWAIAEEDFRRLCHLGENNGESGWKNAPKNVQETCWRISGSHDLSPQLAAVLQELCRYRDEVARALNRPLFKVISDATLLAIAMATPVTLDDLKHLPGMSEGQIHRHGASLLKVVRRGLQMPPVQPPRSRRPDEQYLMRIENLRQWRKETARDIGVKSDVVLPRDVLMIIAEKNPQEIGELKTLLADLPWRLENFGEQILGVIQNHH